MANLKVIVGCSVSFFGLLWLFFWRKSPKQKPPSQSKNTEKGESSHGQEKNETITKDRTSNVSSNKNLPDVVNQGTDFTGVNQGCDFPVVNQTSESFGANQGSDFTGANRGSESLESESNDVKLESELTVTNQQLIVTDLGGQGLESTGHAGAEEILEEQNLVVNQSELVDCKVKHNYCLEPLHKEHDEEEVEESMVQEEVMMSSSALITEASNMATLGANELDMNAIGDYRSSNFSSLEYNSTQLAGSEDSGYVQSKTSMINEAFLASSINDSEMDKTNEKPKDSYHDLSFSTSTLAEPLLESTKLDVTSSENDRSLREDEEKKNECSVPLSDEKDMSHEKSKPQENLNIESKSNSKVAEKDRHLGSNSNHNCDSNQENIDKEDKMVASWSSEAESCDTLNKEISSDLEYREVSGRNGTPDSLGLSKIDHDSNTHGSDSNTSNCDSISSDSSQASSIADGPRSHNSKLQTYKFNFPSEFCGRLIGRHGKNIHWLKEKSGANISLSNLPFNTDYQICTVEGTQRQIEEALKVIGRKFPEVDLTQALPDMSGDSTQIQQPIVNGNGKPMLMADMMQLNLPEGASVDVVVSSIVDVGHVFLQQHTHPLFPSLEQLNQFMINCYNTDGIVPQLPRPLEVGVICSAPMLNGWYRAQITAVYEDTDECDIKYVDYGGFSRVQGCTLRQIRSDFMSLPFQAVECYMANVTPLQDEDYFSPEAAAVLEELTQGKLLQAQVVGRSEDGTPYIHIYQIAGEKVLFVNRELVNRGVTRWIEILS